MSNNKVNKRYQKRFFFSMISLCIISFVSFSQWKKYEILVEKKKNENFEKNLFLGSFLGGVLPIRRFRVSGGIRIKNYDKQRAGSNLRNCNEICISVENCDAWEFNWKKNSSERCVFFENNFSNSIEFHQARNNDYENIVGFIQKRAHTISSKFQTSGFMRKEKILFILHFHHEIIPEGLNRIMKEILPHCWIHDFVDLVVITPQEISLNDFCHGHSYNISSLVNPFAPIREEKSQKLTSLRGANGHMSVPLAMAKFPNYKGYLLVNDDAFVKFSELDKNIWFSEKPWGTFTPHKYTEQVQFRRVIKKRYPFGNYWWSWYNFDSGTVHTYKNATRSNFDAAINAMNELCDTKNIINYMNDTKIVELCINRTCNVLRPYYSSGGKADIFLCPRKYSRIEYCQSTDFVW